jgi:hypothetical protein
VVEPNPPNTPTPAFQFSFIDGVTKETFLAVYGDTFISGFLDGGEFIAVINIIARGKSKVLDIKEHLSAGFYEAQNGQNVDSLASILSKGVEVAMSVSWSGGGQIQDGQFIHDTNVQNVVLIHLPSSSQRHMGPEVCIPHCRRVSAPLHKASQAAHRYTQQICGPYFIPANSSREVPSNLLQRRFHTHRRLDR